MHGWKKMQRHIPTYMNLYLILRKKKNILEFRIGVGIPVPGHTLPKQMNIS